MSQQQSTRPEAQADQEPIKYGYGDVSAVSGELASKPVAPQDAATVQSAENIVLGKGGSAAVTQSAARKNQNNAGVVPHDPFTKQEVTIVETEVAAGHVVTEAVAGQVVGQYLHPGAVLGVPSQRSPSLDPDSITIGEALEATALTAGNKPLDQSDAAAIQAAEVRATSFTRVTPRGVAAAARLNQDK